MKLKATLQSLKNLSKGRRMVERRWLLALRFKFEVDLRSSAISFGLNKLDRKKHLAA